MNNQEMIEEISKVIGENCVGLIRRTAQQIIEKLNYQKVGEGSIVVDKASFEAMVSEYKALSYKYDDTCNRYRLCKDANETIKQHAVMMLKERTIEIIKILKGYSYDGELDELINVISLKYNIKENKNDG